MTGEIPSYKAVARMTRSLFTRRFSTLLWRDKRRYLLRLCYTFIRLIILTPIVLILFLTGQRRSCVVQQPRDNWGRARNTNVEFWPGHGSSALLLPLCIDTLYQPVQRPHCSPQTSRLVALPQELRHAILGHVLGSIEVCLNVVNRQCYSQNPDRRQLRRKECKEFRNDNQSAATPDDVLLLNTIPSDVYNMIEAEDYRLYYPPARYVYEAPTESMNRLAVARTCRLLLEDTLSILFTLRINHIPSAFLAPYLSRPSFAPRQLTINLQPYSLADWYSEWRQLATLKSLTHLHASVTFSNDFNMNQRKLSDYIEDLDAPRRLPLEAYTLLHEPVALLLEQLPDVRVEIEYIGMSGPVPPTVKGPRLVAHTDGCHMPARYGPWRNV